MADDTATPEPQNPSQAPENGPQESAAPVAETSQAATGTPVAETSQAAAGDAEGSQAVETSPARLPRLSWSPSRKAVTIAVALLCAIAGLAGSLIGSHAIANSDAGKEAKQFRAGAAQIATKLESELQHEQDLALAAGTLVAAGPQTSQAEFLAWTRWARVLRRYPELQRLGVVALVHASQLKSFAARVGDSAPASKAPGTASPSARPSRPVLQIVPAGTRPYYCLAIGELVRGAAPRAPAGLDRCARGPSLIATRNTGMALTRVLPGPGGGLAILKPVYRGLAVPRTQQDRIGAFAGWLQEVVKPSVLATRALAGHPGYALRLRYGAKPSAVAVAGVAPSNAQLAASRLAGGWSLQSFGPASLAWLSDGAAVWVLLAGVLASLLLALAILAFGLTRGERPPVVVESKPAPDAPVPSLYDALTGLPGSELTLDRAGRMLARANRQSGILVGALLIDVDWFKDVNEKLGRQAGDQLLKIVAERLENVMRTEDTVGRLRADQFAVLIESAARGMRLDALAQRVIEALHRPIDLEGFGPSFFMTASIGVAFGRYETTDDLMRDAELALRSAKAAGKDRYTLFNANMRSMIEGRGVAEAELNGALQDGQLFLLYEPIYDLGTRRVAGVEALLRWRHPKRGVLTPDDFMDLAQESGLNVPIERWALEDACRRAAAWEVEGRSVGVCLQIAENQLSRDGFITDVRRALQQSGVQPGLLTLLVAETAVMRDVTIAAERLREVKELGVRVAIDDFGGSGYAYHSDLRQLPLDSLRVDRGSLAASEDEDYRNWLLEAILIVGRELSLAVVAKGIESPEQLGALQAMGCNMAQGRLTGEPVAAEAVAGLLTTELPSPPPQPIAMPIQPGGVPTPPPSGTPAPGAGLPVQPSGTPMEPSGAPVQPSGTPMQPSGTPDPEAGMPVQPSGTPMEPSGAPVQPSGTPMQPSGVIMRATGTPMQPAWTPVQMPAATTPPSESPAQPTGTSGASPAASPQAADPSATPTRPSEAPAQPTEAPAQPTEAPALPGSPS
jgi:diguanylate cyclase (GGDEF)-like protein